MTGSDRTLVSVVQPLNNVQSRELFFSISREGRVQMQWPGDSTTGESPGDGRARVILQENGGCL